MVENIGAAGKTATNQQITNTNLGKQKAQRSRQTQLNKGAAIRQLSAAPFNAEKCFLEIAQKLEALVAKAGIKEDATNEDAQKAAKQAKEDLAKGLVLGNINNTLEAQRVYYCALTAAGAKNAKSKKDPQYAWDIAAKTGDVLSKVLFTYITSTLPKS